MMMRSLFFLFFIVSIAGIHLQAQPRPAIRSSVTKNRVLLGEPFQLVIESNIPGGSIVRPVRIDSIPHFEFASEPVIDTIREANGIQIKAVYTLRSFDSGHWVIPSYSLSARIRTDTLGVDVVFSEFDPNQPYHDIKDIIEVEAREGRNYLWYYIIGGVLLLIILIALFARKKKKPVSRQEEARDSYGEAMAALEKLKKNKPGPMEYYSDLVSIFRVFIFKKKGIHSLQKTTNDLVVKLRDQNTDKLRFDKLVQALRLADFVKFAKYSPTLIDDEESWTAIKNGIEDFERTS